MKKREDRDPDKGVVSKVLISMRSRKAVNLQLLT
jgi:hypothetical protein